MVPFTHLLRSAPVDATSSQIGISTLASLTYDLAMEIVEFDDPVEFRSFVDPLLLKREAENCLLLGVTGTLISRPEIYETFHLWAASNRGEPVGAAAVTPPHNLLLAHSPIEGWLVPLSHHIASSGIDLPGAQGNEPTIDSFCRSWQEVRPVEIELDMRLAVHSLTEISPTPRVPGEARPAKSNDVELVVDWIGDFLTEADPLAPRSSLQRTVETRLEADPSLGGLWLWETNGEPRALSGYGGRTPNGVRIGPVYTPPAHRRRGYATALVADQTSWLLESGRSLCFLFTDMSNPISNSIYHKIGYREVANARRYGFRVSR